MPDNELRRMTDRRKDRLRDIVSRWVRSATLTSFLALALAACGTAGGSMRPSSAYEGLNATLWVQSAVEYRALARQAYASATRALARGRADSSWTAALEQTGSVARLPPAVIVDVDETVLDNVRYQGRLLVDGASYAPDTWGAWVAERDADAVPGAVEFARAAAGDGVRVFYITNRDAPLEADTRANLARLGFPVDADGVDVVLTRGERPEWGSDKSSRRAHVARTHRIVLLVGDDLGDFVETGAALAEREAALARHEDRWGERWIVLPNPMYGSWERSLLEVAADTDPLRAKLGRIETGRPRDDPDGGAGPRR